MEAENAILSAAVIGILCFILFCVVAYKSGWKSFVINDKENFEIDTNQVGDIRNVHQIKFRECIYTITSSAKDVKTKDVTNIMNNMLYAYKNSPTGSEYIIRFSNPGLTSLTFVVDGVSDSKTVANNKGAILDKWKPDKATAKLKGKYKRIKGFNF